MKRHILKHVACSDFVVFSDDSMNVGGNNHSRVYHDKYVYLYIHGPQRMNPYSSFFFFQFLLVPLKGLNFGF